MKFFGTNVKDIDKGYFGVRRCTNCNCLRDVNLLELHASEHFFFIPINKLGVKRFLICNSCGAALEIDKDLWEYYKKYDFRFDKTTTDNIVETLKNINTDLLGKNVSLNFDDKDSESALNLIYQNLCKKYKNPANIEEIISVYFSAE